jgi:hypothetical protein
MYPIPFRIVLGWHRENSPGAELAEQIRARFHGDDTGGRQDDSGVNTGSIRLDTDVIRRSRATYSWAWHGRTASGPNPVVHDRRTRTLVVALVDHRFANDPGYVAWLEDTAAKAVDPHHVIFPVIMAEGDDRRYAETGGTLFAQIQGLRYFLQPDPPLRPAHLMLRIAYEACRLLGGKGVRVFLSHAKADGLPLVQSFRSLIGDLAWLPYFYDVKDLAPGQNWANEIRKGVRDSALIIVRTGAYDGREWCRAEVDEALKHQVAMVCVEAAERAQRDQNPTYLNNIPVVRVTDGDLFRPLDALLREQLRCLILRRLHDLFVDDGRIDRDRTLLLVRPPELVDLFRMRDRLRGGIDQIVYPGPSMPHREREMLDEVARSMFSCTLKSTDDFYGSEVRPSSHHSPHSPESDVS